MTTRLDRLLSLLDTGSTFAVRRSAAEQLGEVQRLYPHELENLLLKVHKFLCSTQWETRVAGGLAVECISQKVQEWKPAELEAKPDDGCEVDKKYLPVGQLRLAQFDVDKVLSQGALLLGSQGTEYDCFDTGVCTAQHLAEQKQLLNKRLGLDISGGLGVNIAESNTSEDLFKEEDLMIKQESQCVTLKPEDSVKMLIERQLTGNGKEATHIGRKYKHKVVSSVAYAESDSSSKDSWDGGDDGPPKKLCRTTSVVVAQPGVSNKILVDSVPDLTVNIENRSEWPFASFCDLLTTNMFHPNWERRHGALTALRSIIKLHGGSAGKIVNMTSSEMETANQLWLEDLSTRLICILALDRFGDFVSDEVVAPVRETCAQVLGMTALHLSATTLRQVVETLVQLLDRDEWETRHGGLLGVKYVLAARQDVDKCILDMIRPALFNSLMDKSDDVRAVAAVSLLPVVDALISSVPHQVSKLTESLWSTLEELDDLTSSTNSVMNLLATLLVHPSVASVQCCQTSPAELVPRIWPFLHHTLVSVRRAALKALSSLLMGCRLQIMNENTVAMSTVLSNSFRHIYQRCLLEEVPDVLQLVHQAWCELLSSCTPVCLLVATSSLISTWLCLMMQPSSVPFDSSLLVEMMRNHKEPLSFRSPMDNMPAIAQCKYYIGGAVSLSESARQRDVVVTRARCTAAKLLGTLVAHISRHCHSEHDMATLESIGSLFAFYLGSRSTLQKSCCAYVIAEWNIASNLLSSAKPTPEKLPDVILVKLHECLIESCFYDEVLFSLSRMQTECRDFVAGLRQAGIRLDDALYSPNMVLTLDQANTLCTTVYDSVRHQLRSTVQQKHDDRRTSVLNNVSQTMTDHLLFTNRVQSSVSAAVILWNSLPDKMNPVIRPLMDSLKREENADLQHTSADSLAKLVHICASAASSPNSKVIKNLCTMLTCDPKFTPVIGQERATFVNDVETANSDTDAACDTFSGILALSIQLYMCEMSRSKKLPVLRQEASSFCPDIPAEAVVHEDNATRLQLLVQRRGAMFALTTIAREAAENLPQHIPALWDAMLQPLKTVLDNGLESVDRAQEIIYCLQILQVEGPSVHASLHNELLKLIDCLLVCLCNKYTAVRHMASRCIGMLSRLSTAIMMEHVVRQVLPLLGASDSDLPRLGAIESIALLIDQLGIQIVPYVSLLILPVLGRMSDQNRCIRLMATSCFASLIRLMPLDRRNDSTAPAMSESLQQLKNQECLFLDQLLDPQSIESYHVPVPIKADLRKYQQDGVNWLAFLARYKLHGILCDDMGLGKTIQTLCVVAGDHYQRQQTFLETGGQADCSPLPSIVICPPTVTGHWVHEIEKFIGNDILNPLHYVGPPAERARLQSQFSKHNIVLASYDVVRNDIDFFSKIQWNYCILDEGHIIKNSKTKISKAVKKLVSNHRLILTGTPIQNNVLELWSLFDFLMPGFLGTEKQFQTLYGRPILQSRDPKSSSKEQEAGALAMEALHRQVLPFLLRRLKDTVLQDLPPKIIQDYYCDLSPLQIQLYEDFAKSRARKSINDDLQVSCDELDENATETTSGNTVAAVHVFQALQYLRKVCNHPALVVTPQHPQYAEICSHLSRNKTSLRDIQHAPKLIALQQLLSDCGIGNAESAGGDTSQPVINQHRVLIFCQLKSMLDIVERDLFRSLIPSVTYLRLDGSVPAGNRHAIVNRFNNDPSIDVLLLTTHVGGLGLNLTGADTVIFVEHDWNPMKDLQAMDRTHRIGQKKVVNVYRLIARNSLEEKIMGLQKFKLNIANTVINEENRSLASMGTDQLLDLFTLGSGPAGEGSERTARQSASSSNRLSKSVLDSMEELWDTAQYDTEYDLNAFMKSVAKDSS